MMGKAMALAALLAAAQAWCAGPRLDALAPKAVPMAPPGEHVGGSWGVDLGLGSKPDEVWTPAAPKGLHLDATWRRVGKSTAMVCDAWLTNDRAAPVMVGRARFILGPIAIGGSIAGNEYLYPPQVFQELRGPVSEATPGFMGRRYIYGSFQATDKLSLPVAAIWDGAARTAVGLGCRNDEAVVRVGVAGGDVGRLEAHMAIYRRIPPDGKAYLGRVMVGVVRTPAEGLQFGHGYDAMASLKKLCLACGVIEPPARPPAFVKRLQIAWIGPFSAPYRDFDDITAHLPAMARGGINAIILGGRLWYCRDSQHPGTGDFLPILRDGHYSVDDAVSGGVDALRRLIDEGHHLGIKVFCWGPTLAGISLESPDVAAHPNWWIRKADGGLSFWYPQMAPPDASVAGWRRFILSTVRDIASKYRFDGCWLDSTWKDHALNLESPTGWYGGPNGAKLSLVRDVRRLVKSINPDFVLMAESGGADTASAVDISYVRSLGVFPLVKADRMQDVVRCEEACRVENERPFGQFQIDPGPLAEVHPPGGPLLLRASWQATLFLINTLPRVPSYFVGDPLAGLLDQPELGRVTRRLIDVRRSRPELIDGKVVFEGIGCSAPQVVRFCRVLGGQACLVVVNCGAKPVSAHLALSGETARVLDGRKLGDLLGEAKLSARGPHGFDVSLPAYRGAILAAQGAAASGAK